MIGRGVVGLCFGGTLLIVRGASAAHPLPRVGERLSVFTATYGKPVQLGTARGLKVGNVTVEGVRFYADRAHTIIVNAQPPNGIVRNLVVTGPSSFTQQQSIA